MSLSRKVFYLLGGKVMRFLPRLDKHSRENSDSAEEPISGVLHDSAVCYSIAAAAVDDKKLANALCFAKTDAPLA